MNRSDRQTIHSVQVLRAIAALAVAYCHYATHHAGTRMPEVGSWGVDLFFVISGFIIARLATHSNRQFLRKRLIRVVPMYALGTLLTVLAAIFVGDLVHTSQVTPTYLAKSLLFIPFEISPTRQGPILAVGWTLSYEVFFYLTVGVSVLVAGRVRAQANCGGANHGRVGLVWAAALLALIALSGPIAKSPVYAVGFFQSGLLYEFLLGIAIHYLWRRQGNSSQAAGPGHPAVAVLSLVLMAAAFVSLAAQELGTMVAQGHGLDWGFDRAISFGIPAGVIVATALRLERHLPSGRIVRFAVGLGDASYCMYLFHLFVVLGISRLLLVRLPLESAPVAAEIGVVVVVLIATSLVSLAVDQMVDQPIQRFLRRTLLSRPEPIAQAVAEPSDSGSSWPSHR